MAKCALYWGSSNRPKSAEVVASVLGRQLSTPCVTRWSSLYRALDVLLTDKEKLKTLSEKLDLPQFRDTEFDFLDEYRGVLYPIATAIDVLQKSRSGYNGELLPTIVTVEKKLLAQKGKVRHGSVILDSCLSGLQKRFSGPLRMENEEAIITSCSHPYFKMRWAPNEVPRASDFESFLLRAAEAHGPDHKNTYDDTSSATINHGFYAFEDEDFPTSGRSEQTHVLAEVFRYPDDPRKDFAMLQDFPAIKSVFVHYNTNLCSSAPVERHFSFASLVLRPNRRCLEDSLFEKLLLLKCN